MAPPRCRCSYFSWCISPLASMPSSLSLQGSFCKSSSCAKGPRSPTRSSSSPPGGSRP
ncbi:leucine-rich repeat transmembrane protein FLRT2-like [Sesbania bispinosa]|nr:leucine-rich repeat transmembrane protein FLRT2-like [Sesbania bispinosa]